MSPRQRKLLLVTFAVSALSVSVDASGESANQFVPAINCEQEAVSVGKFLETAHDVVVDVTNRCLTCQIDVYQRFSGHIVKHRIGRICENALAVLESFRTLLTAVVPFPGSTNRPCELAQELPINALIRTADNLPKFESAIVKAMADMNAAGDGSLSEGLHAHIQSIVSNLHALEQVWQSQSLETSLRQLPGVATAMMEALGNVFKAVLDHASAGVTYNVGELGIRDLTKFLASLESFPAFISVDVRRVDDAASKAQCHEVPDLYLPEHSYDPLTEPSGWLKPDVSGMVSPRPSVQKLLWTLSKSLPLAYTVVGIVPRAQAGVQELTSEYRKMFQETGGFTAPASDLISQAGLRSDPICKGIGLAYSPAHCLFDNGWGSMMFSLNTDPPFDGVLSVSELTAKALDDRPKPFVQPVANATASIEKLIDQVDSVYKSLNTPSPDLLFLSPMVGNCLTFRKLGPSRRIKGTSTASGPPQITPKLVIVPINPLVPPPWELAPNFAEWHEAWIHRQKRQGSSFRSGFRAEAEWWLAQCSLQSAAMVLAEQGYDLLHVEHSFAVFIMPGLWPALASAMPQSGGAKVTATYDHWLRGWFCSAAAPTLFGLNWVAGEDLASLQDASIPVDTRRNVLCNFVLAHNLPLVNSTGKNHPCDYQHSAQGDPDSTDISHQQSWRTWDLQDLPDEKGKSYLLQSQNRGRCLPELGICECFPPYRGRFCENEEPGLKNVHRDYKAVLHYLVGDKENLLADFVVSLALLWKRFNFRFDYPVVVFHDGMSSKSRLRILESSRNRIWFALVEDYTKVPAHLKGKLELDSGGYQLGYRGMCRFRSGPMFTQPVMRSFDYAWTLDTDGYFPADINTDPFERMHKGNFVFSYSHISRDQASAVQHFWEFCRLYLESKEINPKQTKMMRRLTDALVLRDTYWHEWNRVLFMNDIEITRLEWFRGQQYQDFFSFLDSVGGFWLYRWGDHAVRTIAIALWLSPDKLMSMGVPYGHQDTCRCGNEHPDDVCVRTAPGSWWRCLPRPEAAAMGNGAEKASGDVGTLDPSIIFGGT